MPDDTTFEKVARDLLGFVTRERTKADYALAGPA